jgi:CheY-like chemotaxis protein
MTNVVHLPRTDRVLVVDDDPVNLKIWKAALSGMCRLEFAGSGKEALEIFPRFRPSLVVLDRMMPGMHGDIVLQHLRALDPTCNTKIVMHSALAREEEQIDGMRKGADLYITKEVSMAVAVTQIRSLLSMQRFDCTASLLSAIRKIRNSGPSYAADFLTRGVLQYNSLLVENIEGRAINLIDVLEGTFTVYTGKRTNGVPAIAVRIDPDIGEARILGNRTLLSGALAGIIDMLLLNMQHGDEVALGLSLIDGEYIISVGSGNVYFSREAQKSFFRFDIETLLGQECIGTALAFETAVRHGGDLRYHGNERHSSFALHLPAMLPAKPLVCGALS